MQRRNEQSIGEILQQYLRTTQVEDLVYGDQIAAVWRDLLGDEVASATERLHLHDGQLSVRLRSAALKHELLMRRTAIAHAVNQRLGATVVRTVLLR